MSTFRIAFIPGHIRCVLQSRNLCGWISGDFLVCHLHLECPGATDSLESAIFVRLHRLVVIGRLLDWFTTAVLACTIIW